MSLAAGIARAHISPPLNIPNGMWMAQRHIRANGLDMELSATVLILANGELRLALLDLDLTFLQDDQAAAIRQAVHEATGVVKENVLPFCTHSHAGPVTQSHYEGEGRETVLSYIQSLPHTIAEAAFRANQSLQPVRASAGVGHSDIGINRDLRLPDGRFVVGCNPKGFFDPEVGVIRIDAMDGRALACIVNYACHPTVLGPENKLISPDYPGSTRQTVEQNTGAMCFFLQGAAGNVGPVETFVSDAAVARNLGRRLGLEAAKVYLGLTTTPSEKRLKSVIQSGAALAEYETVDTGAPSPRLAFASGFAQLPTRSPLGEVYEKAPSLLEEWKANLSALQSNKAGAKEIAYATQQVARFQLRIDRMNRYKGEEQLPVETYAIRIGDTAIVAISGEPYSEIGAEVKAKSPFRGKTLFAGYVGGDMMYIPTAEAFNFNPPPMEVDNSPYAPKAAQVAVEHLIDLLVQLGDE